MNMVIKNEQILDAAAAVLSKRPDATLQSIAMEAGVSRTTIFNKFPTRDALLEALGKDTLLRIGDAMSRVPGGQPDDLVAVMFDVTRGLMSLGPRTIFLRLVLDQGADFDSQWEQAVRPLAIYIGTAQALGRLRVDQPARWLVVSYIGLLFAAWDEIAAEEMGSAQAARLIVQTWLAGAGHVTPVSIAEAPLLSSGL